MKWSAPSTQPSTVAAPTPTPSATSTATTTASAAPASPAAAATAARALAPCPPSNAGLAGLGGGPAGATELPDRRTRTSRTSRHADGTFTTTLFNAPIHYRDARGDWQEIQSALVPAAQAGYACRNQANDFGVWFKSALDSDYLRVEVAGRPFSLSLAGAAHPGASPTPALVGASTTPASTAAVPLVAPAAVPATGRGATGLSYAGLWPGVELQYELLAEGVKETLVLAGPGAPTHYRFWLSPPPGAQVSAERRIDGAWLVWLAPFAQPALVLEAPRVFESDAQGLPLPTHAPATLELTRVGERFALDLRLDAQWLQDPQRRFPVLLDPTMLIQPSLEDASFDAACPSCTASATQYVHVGTTASTTMRGAIKFDLGDIPAGANVTDAQLRLFLGNACYGRYCSGTVHQAEGRRQKAEGTKQKAESRGLPTAYCRLPTAY